MPELSAPAEILTFAALMQDPSEYHRKRAESSQVALGALKKRLRWAVLGRVLVFLAIGGNLYLTWGAPAWIPILSSIAWVGLFLFLVRLHARWNEQKAFHEEKVELHNADIARIQGQHPEWDDRVLEELSAPDPDHPFAEDLDLFDRKGLMGWLDRSFSSAGKKRLVQRLLHPEEDPEKIRETQQGVGELAELADERMDWRAYGRKVRDLEVPDPRGESLKRSLHPFFRYGIALLMLGFFTALLLGLIPFSTFLLTLILPFSVLAVHASKVRKGFERMKKERGWVSGLSDILQRVEGMGASSWLLREQQARLRMSDGSSASEALKSLDRILELYEARSNPFIGLGLNSLLLWDIQCYENLRAWERLYGDALADWVDCIAELDSLSSLASIASDHPTFSFPSFNGKGEKVLEGEGLGHPLIPDAERVDNDLEIPSTGHIKIVTGANMAGKSTFLRTVGVNWILAKAGTVVCAQNMAFRPLSLFSSMRTSDDLVEHESFFYAELKRLRMIVDELEKGKEMMILLDEILQGTNSEDKKRGSRRFLERILQYPVAGLIATHDLDLTRMEESHPKGIENLCFEAELEDGHSTFDHLLRKGVCRNMNASALMERMGIG